MKKIQVQSKSQWAVLIVWMFLHREALAELDIRASIRNQFTVLDTPQTVADA